MGNSLAFTIRGKLSSSFNAATKGAQSKLGGIETKLGKIKSQFSSMKGEMVAAGGAAFAMGKLYSSATDELQAQGQLASLEISERGIQSITKAGSEMATQFGQITAPAFIKASYDIKSGISSLSESGVRDFTKMAATTAVATKASVEQMTKLYALGYGIFREDFGSDLEFGKSFSGGIAQAVQSFKTDGADLSQGLANIGSDAKAMGVSLAEEVGYYWCSQRRFELC